MQPILKVFMILIGVGILWCGLGVWYYYGIFLPSEQKRIIQEERIEKTKQDQQTIVNKEKNTICIDEAKKYSRERWFKTCELVKQEKNLELRDCKKPSTITGKQYYSDEHCEAQYGYKEESPGRCVDNEYAWSIYAEFGSSVEACNKKFPIE
jgi:hypothetical protein